jgi:phosphonate transport system ATP-binding protein
MTSIPLLTRQRAAIATLDPPATGAVATPAIALAARDVWLSYDGQGFALRGVDLEIERGMTMALGRSGSGKTSLLRVLAGLVQPQRGAVDGSGCTVAYVPQTLGLLRGMTALENTLAGSLRETGTARSLFRLFTKRTKEEAQHVLHTLGLGHKIHEQVRSLSGGERQRVAIARALMQHPDVVLADEFVSQLDPVTTSEILEQMRGIAAQGVAFLITTHETDIVASHADHVVVLRDGEVVYANGAEGLSTAALFERLK